MSNTPQPPNLDPGSSRIRQLTLSFWLALVIAATFITYAPALHQYFFLDDFWHLAKASRTTIDNFWQPWQYSAKDYQAYWFASTRVHHLTEPGFFRPLVTILYAVGLALWGAAPGPFHALNILGQLLTVAVVFWIGYRLFASGWAAAFCAAVFGLHPAQYETVQWIAANADVMMGLFSTLSIAAFIEYSRGHRRARWFYALTLVSMVLALCAKEMAGILPVVFLAVAWLEHHGKDKQTWRQILANRYKAYLPIAAIILAYGLWRLPSAMGIYSLHTSGDYMVHMANPLMIPQVLLNFAFYMFHFLLLYPVWPMNFAAIFGVHSWWIAALCLVALFLIARAGAHFAGPARRQFWFGIWWLALVILPFCILVPAQRIAHLPSVGFAIALTAVAVGLSRRVKAAATANWLRIAAIVLLTLYATVTSTYVSMMGNVSSLVRRVVVGLEQQVHNQPRGTEIYVLNLWQPAWMFEHIFPVKYPKQNYHIHVLSFSPNMLPMVMRQDPGLVQQWFGYLFPNQARYKPVTIHFNAPRSLRLSVKHGVFFHGLVEGELPVAPEAQQIGRTIDDGSFTATATAGKNNAITGITFHWKQPSRPVNRIFLEWTQGHWKRLIPPPLWNQPTPVTSPHFP